MKNVAVFVLGDIGRSPRMQYHALSLSKFCKVSLIGLSGTSKKKKINKKECHEKIENNENIKKHEISESYWTWINSTKLSKPAFLLLAPIKVLLQIFIIFMTLLTIKVPDMILIQNPPSIPTLFIILFYSFFTRSKVIIDFHNFGWTILALNMGENSFIVKVARFIEINLSKFCDYSFCVSKNMKKKIKLLIGFFHFFKCHSRYL
jgi:beta-1,4-mannosyltransferase